MANAQKTISPRRRGPEIKLPWSLRATRAFVRQMMREGLSEYQAVNMVESAIEARIDRPLVILGLRNR